MSPAATATEKSNGYSNSNGNSSPAALLPNGEQQHQATTAAEVTPPTVLGDVARVRSKNAGPFEVTYDAMFSSAAAYHLVQRSGLLTPKTVAAAVGCAEADILWSGFFDPALAYKVTVPRFARNSSGSGSESSRRVVPSGSFMESDVHASQKYIDLLNLPLPADLVASLVKSARWENGSP